ncbi:hypothetical protein IC803_14485 [Geobacillus sp. 46C-IIa]|uniref:hypothetical protein n=1 Tax=Geobacillus sp. 46C-IIa TaxID=1963025 RepID=UPI00168068F1|nr:hypothetical protein [Geobacillus sp. 46C-IIa]QNU27465.1 hypothetical protein IC803_14485 [Geobacillus sp. 46C-IIa]
MYVVLSASRLMKAKEIRKLCAELRNNPTLILVLNAEAKAKLYNMKKAVSSTPTAS